MPHKVIFRSATEDDVPAIVALLADDAIGAGREGDVDAYRGFQRLALRLPDAWLHVRAIRYTKGSPPAMVVLAASARLDADDVLRIRWAEPPADDVALTLRNEGTAHTVRLDGEAADLSQLDLADGTWSVHTADAEVITIDPGFSLDGLADYARQARTRALRTFRAPSGGLRVGVRSVEPYAEVTAVHPGEEKLILEGFLAYGATPETAEIVAARRKTSDKVTGEATVTGHRWRAELPNAPFAVETERGFWDLHLGGLTVATWLDDIAQKKTKVRFPARHVARDTDRVRVRAYYTDQDQLAIATTVVANAEAS